jgi:hypothetical protein
MKRSLRNSLVIFSFVNVIGCGDDVPFFPDAASLEGDGGTADVNQQCGVSFSAPLEGKVFTVADDKDKDSCANGFQTDVTLAVAAPNGTTVGLLVGATPAAPAVVMGGQVTFPGVQLTEGPLTLTAQVGTNALCTAKVAVTVMCNVPTCNITKPTLTPMHPALNGVPSAMGGDRVSSAGSDYQAAFEVTTNVEDGQVVSLRVSPETAPTVSTVVNATAMGGKALFPGVTLRPDGTYKVVAECTNRIGVKGSSQLGSYPVDTVPPTLAVTSPTEGEHFGPSDLTMEKFNVCASTTSTDAIALPDVLPAMGRNLCAAIGNASPECVKVAAMAPGGNACVPLTCPGGAPFDITVSLTDAAGNPTASVVKGVTCASTKPSVAIVTPAGDMAPYADVSKHLLAASSSQAFKDLDAAKAGAQTNVVACTNKAGKAQLFAGPEGGTLAAVGAAIDTVPAVAADNCPSGLTLVAKYTSVTIPESQADALGRILKATALRVDVTEVSTEVGSSPIAQVWVDVVPPVILPRSPAPELCNGPVRQSSTDWTVPVVLASDTGDVSLSVENSSGNTSYPLTNYTNLVATFADVIFRLGANRVTVTGTDPAGNQGALESPCVVTVGTPPVVSFSAPSAGKNLCASDATAVTCVADGDAAAGWQGTLTASVVVSGTPAASGTVTFSIEGGATLGVAPITAGQATLANVTIPDSALAKLVATTSEFAGNGTGAASFTTVVDTIAPPEPASVVATIKDRRATTVHLDWTAPTDVGGLSGYDVRVSTAPIDAGNFAQATPVPYGGTPAAPGMADGLDVAGLLIETKYYCGVVAIDKAGNRSVAKLDCEVIAKFNRTTFTPPAAGTAENFGRVVDGSGDLVGDARSDLIVGANLSRQVYVFEGGGQPFAVSGANPPATVNSPRITIVGSTNFFGSSVALVDIDNDQRDDIVVGSVLAAKVFIFKGRDKELWPQTLAEGQADYVLSGPSGSALGWSAGRLGDFNGDGIEDLAIGAPLSGPSGRVFIVLGRQGFASLDVSTAPASEVITVSGEAALAGSFFGSDVVGLAGFYSAGTGTLVASAFQANSTAGKIYSFRGQNPGSGAIGAESRDHAVDGIAGSSLGFGLSVLGPGVTALPGVGVITPNSGFALLGYGTSTTGPFADARRIVGSGTDVRFGTAVFGGGLSGKSTRLSFIASKDDADVVMVPRTSSGGPPTVYILDSTRLAGLAVDSPSSVSDVSVEDALPADWNITSVKSGPIVDLNGDGYSDIAIGETAATGSIDGRVVVLW